MVRKLNSIAIFCMLCSAAIPSMMANCAQCSDCDNTDKDKDRSKTESVMRFQAATEDKKSEKQFIFDVEEKDRSKTEKIV
jgi:hypothetical protein